jgi:DNA repair protein RadD
MISERIAQRSDGDSLSDQSASRSAVAIYPDPDPSDAYDGGRYLSREDPEGKSHSLGAVGEIRTAGAVVNLALSPVVSFLDVLPATCDVLRPHQREQLGRVSRALHAGYRRPLVQLPTGGGKTHEIASITLAATVTGLRVLILATRTRLIRQISERLTAFRAAHGIIAASLPELIHAAARIQVASADTLHRRCIADQRRPLPGADVVIFDEAHLAVADSRLGILQRYPDAIRLGFTATPARRSGRSLGEAFDCLVTGPSVLELIQAGLLVRPRIFNSPIVTTAELKAIPKDAANDYAAGALADVMRRPKLIGDVVSNYLRIAAGKRALVFACSKAHGADLSQEFCRAGIAAELLTDQDDEAGREAAIARLEAGQTHVLVNCFLMAYGVDVPSVEAIVLARPTRSLVMYLQMVGRGLRPAPGKDHCLLIDHGRVVETLGLPTANFDWSLDGRRNVNREALARHGRTQTAERPRTCPECQHTWLVSELGNACRECGWAPTPKARPIAVQEADLAEIADDPAAVSPHSTEVTQFFCEAVAWYGARWPDRWRERPNSGRWWAWNQARRKFKFPDSVAIPRSFWEATPAPPSSTTSGYLKHSLIRYAKGRAKGIAA